MLEPERIVRLEADAVVLLDQRQLPGEEVDVVCRTAAEVADAIRRWSSAVLRRSASRPRTATRSLLAHGEDPAAADRRPAPVAADRGQPRVGARPDARRPASEQLGSSIATRSSAAARWPRIRPRCSTPGTRALTHCNAGGLATGGYGSAVGALLAAWERGLLEHVWVDETRPLLQGARLTAWELETAEIPHAVIADSAAASLMAAGEVDCVITGADRIAANGDTANKIGTYSLAVLARHHGIPLYVVAPTSTVDLATPDGAAIPIEERDPAEVTDALRRAQPGVRRHPGRADHGDRHRAGRAPRAVRGSLAAAVAPHEGDRSSRPATRHGCGR